MKKVVFFARHVKKYFTFFIFGLKVFGLKMTQVDLSWRVSRANRLLKAPISSQNSDQFQAILTKSA